MQSFAQTDAARFRLRDRLRADQIIKSLIPGKDTYIEAGPIHSYLLHQLRRQLAANWQLKTKYIERSAMRQMGLRGRIFSPGDELTVRYLFQRKNTAPSKALLCARALIFAKIIQKEEYEETDCLFPHTRDEWFTVKSVNSLSYSDCKKLFFKIRPLTTEQAGEAVQKYLHTIN